MKDKEKIVEKKVGGLKKEIKVKTEVAKKEIGTLKKKVHTAEEKIVKESKTVKDKAKVVEATIVKESKTVKDKAKVVGASIAKKSKTVRDKAKVAGATISEKSKAMKDGALKVEKKAKSVTEAATKNIVKTAKAKLGGKKHFYEHTNFKIFALCLLILIIFSLLFMLSRRSCPRWERRRKVHAPKKQRAESLERLDSF